MFWLIVSVSDRVSSSVWRPTTARRVVCAIWLIAAETFSIATTDLDRIDDPEVGDRGDVDADVVAGDDPLRLDRHGHDPQGDAVDAVDERHEHDQPRAERAVADTAEPEHDGALVLLDDVHRGEEQATNTATIRMTTTIWTTLMSSSFPPAVPAAH